MRERRDDNRRMNARPIAFVVWAAVAASAVFWLLRLTAGSPSAPPHTVAVSTAQTPRGDLSRVLGAPPVVATPGAPLEPALASRFKLLGVAAPREGGERSGLALIAVDGKPARGFKVGAAVDGEIVLQSSIHAARRSARAMRRRRCGWSCRRCRRQRPRIARRAPPCRPHQAWRRRGPRTSSLHRS